MIKAVYWSRRRALIATFGMGSACASLGARAAEEAHSGAGSNWIELFNTHTGEIVSVEFRNDTGPIPAAVAKLEHLLRDHRTNETHAIDPLLYMQLSVLALQARSDARFDIISGYRSPATNAALGAAGRGVAKRSLHMEGRALDVRLRGVSCASLRDSALALARGGVGYYPRSDFVHLDTGRVRSWHG